MAIGRSLSEVDGPLATAITVVTRVTQTLLRM